MDKFILRSPDHVTVNTSNKRLVNIELIWEDERIVLPIFDSLQMRESIVRLVEEEAKPGIIKRIAQALGIS